MMRENGNTVKNETRRGHSAQPKKARDGLAARLVDVLQSHGVDWPGGRKNATIQRTRAGYWQRARGAWSWCLQAKNGGLAGWPAGCVGSTHPAKLVAALGVAGTTVHVSEHTRDIHLDPKR